MNNWHALIQEQIQSGLTAKDWCKEEGINVHTFYAKKSQLRLNASRNSSRFYDKIFDDYKASGKTMVEYCKLNNISYAGLANYKYRNGLKDHKHNKPKSDIEWSKIISDQIQSGLNMQDYCYEHDISYKTFTKAKYRLESNNMLSALDKSTLWRSRVSEQEDSGLTAKEWCYRNGINLYTFYSWRSKVCRNP